MIEDPELEYISRKALREHKKRVKKAKKEARVDRQGREWVEMHRRDSMVKPEFKQMPRKQR